MLIDFSLIITAHDEGLLAHKMMLSILRSLQGITERYELIIHIDNGAPETIEYFERYQNDSSVRIIQNRFGDLGASRNFCAQHARGKYLIFVDADDLISTNYLPDILSTLKSAPARSLVHPEYNISFWGTRFQIWRTLSNRSHEETAYLLFARNQWPSPCAAERQLFLDHPYLLTKHGYGHEDYNLNIELAACGIQHILAPSIAYFYRQKPHSLMRANDASHVTQPYSSLFDIPTWKEYQAHPSLTPTSKPLSPKQKLLQTYIRARGNRILNSLITPAATIARRLTGKKLIADDDGDNVPREILPLWQEISSIEPSLTLSSHPDVSYYEPNANSFVSAAYHSLCLQIPKLPDYVFIASSLSTEPPDQKAWHYIKSFCLSHPHLTIGVILIHPLTTPLSLPDNLFSIDYGSEIDGRFMEWDRDLLLTRLLIQLKVKDIHLIDASDGYKWAIDHPELIKSHFRLSLTLFEENVLPSASHFSSEYLSWVTQLYPQTSQIYTDHQSVIDYLDEFCAFSPDKILLDTNPLAHKQQI